MAMMIVHAIPTEADDLATLYHAAYAENAALGFPASAGTVKADEVKSWTEEMVVFVAKQQGALIGAVRLKWDDQWLCYVLSRLAVLPRCKGTGIGTVLMQQAEKWANEKGESHIRLTVAQGHPYLIEMYQKKGYEIAGEMILDQLPYNEYVMEKRLRINERM